MCFSADGDVRYSKICIFQRVIEDDRSSFMANPTNLIGGFEHLKYFSIYWEFHHPN